MTLSEPINHSQKQKTPRNKCLYILPTTARTQAYATQPMIDNQFTPHLRTRLSPMRSRKVGVSPLRPAHLSKWPRIGAAPPIFAWREMTSRIVRKLTSARAVPNAGASTQRQPDESAAPIVARPVVGIGNALSVTQSAEAVQRER